MDTKKLRQKILDLAIRGKLVPQDPNDEPASVLLERIKAEKERLIKEGKIKRSKKSAKTSDTPHYENVPFEVPDSWVWCKLEEICNIKGGKRIPKGKGFSAQRTEHIYLRVTNMKNRTISLDDLKYIDDDVFQEIRNYTISSDDLYLTIAGTIGDVGEIPQEVSGMNLTENAAKLTDIVCDRLYLMYSLLSTNSQEHFSSKYHQVAQPKLSIETASSTLLPLPPFAEQRRIVAEIERWFSMIDIIENDQYDLQTTVKQTKSKILDLAIHGKLVPQDPNDEPAIELLKRINPDFTPCDNGHYPQLPDSWSTTTLKDLCESINGLWKGKKEPFIHVGVIRNANFTKDFKLDYSNIEYIDVEQRTFAKRHLMNGDLIVEKSGGSDNNPVGRTILYEGESGVFSFSNFTMVLRIKHSNTILNKFLYYYILAIYQKGAMRLMQTQTTGLHNLILDKFLSMPIHMPSYSEQERIVDRIETIFISLDMIRG